VWAAWGRCTGWTRLSHFQAGPSNTPAAPQPASFRGVTLPTGAWYYVSSEAGSAYIAALKQRTQFTWGNLRYSQRYYSLGAQSYVDAKCCTTLTILPLLPRLSQDTRGFQTRHRLSTPFGNLSWLYRWMYGSSTSSLIGRHEVQSWSWCEIPALSLLTLSSPFSHPGLAGHICCQAAGLNFKSTGLLASRVQTQATPLILIRADRYTDLRLAVDGPVSAAPGPGPRQWVRDRKAP
jgi:hypothetical protein